MSVMKAIYQMREETDIMRENGVMSNEEIDEFVSRFCEEHGFEKPAVDNVLAFSGQSYLPEETSESACK